MSRSSAATTNTTNSTTNVRDIGLTGQQAVDAINTIAAFGNLATSSAYDSLNNLVNQSAAVTKQIVSTTGAAPVQADSPPIDRNTLLLLAVGATILFLSRK